MPTVKELRDKRANLISQGRELLDRCESDNRALSADEEAQWGRINSDIDRLGQAIERSELLDRHAAGHKPILNAGDLSAAAGSAVGDLQSQKPKKRLNDDETARLSTLALAGWLRSPTDVEDDEFADEINAAATAIRCNLGKSRAAFPLRRDNARIMREFAATRLNAGMTIGTSADGGYLLPQGFVPRLEVAMVQENPLLQLAEVIRTQTGVDLPWPTMDDTGNAGAQLDEATAVGDPVKPTIGRRVFKAYKFSSGLVPVSSELLQDSPFDTGGLLGDACGLRLGRILASKMTTGTGSSTIQGVVVGASSGKTAASTSAITFDEIFDLQYSVPEPYCNSGAFMMNRSTLGVVRKLKDSNGQYLWAPAVGGAPDTINGAPVYTNRNMAAIGASAKTVLFGDFKQYKVRLVAQIRARRLDERYADTDEVGFISFLRADAALLNPLGSGNVVKYLAHPAS